MLARQTEEKEGITTQEPGPRSSGRSLSRLCRPLHETAELQSLTRFNSRNTVSMNALDTRASRSTPEILLGSVRQKILVDYSDNCQTGQSFFTHSFSRFSSRNRVSKRTLDTMASRSSPLLLSKSGTNMAFAQLPFASSAYCMIVMRHSEYTRLFYM